MESRFGHLHGHVHVVALSNCPCPRISIHMKIQIAIYEGCGNDFILIDNRKQHLAPSFYPQIPSFCCNYGTDGLILLENSSTCDYRMRIFNSDGKEAEMCGNGVRCLTRFIQALGDHRRTLSLQAMERQLAIYSDGDQIAVDMGMPSDVRWSIPLVIGKEELVVHHVNTGVPHCVIFHPFLGSDADFAAFGRTIRSHPHFAPYGANVNVAKLSSDSQMIPIRTYERGVEAETLACGTGATAVAFAAGYLFQIPWPIAIQTRGGLLMIDKCTKNESIEGLRMSGPANFVCRDEIQYC
jgi:diaminopimelate epimerase